MKLFLEKIKNAGGKAYLVGGSVRDFFLSRPSKDIDIEVFGITREKLVEILYECGDVNEVGESFSVFKLDGMDISLPRRDIKTGEGHKGFVVEYDPLMSLEDASARRDFSINSIMKDLESGEFIDLHNGLQDLANKIIRATSPTSFSEDPLRVLRMVQFAGRFDFDIDPETFELAKKANISELPVERIWGEFEKIILKSVNIKRVFKYLIDLGITEQVLPGVTVNDDVVESLNTLYSYKSRVHSDRFVVLFLAILFSDKSNSVFDVFNIKHYGSINLEQEVLSLHFIDPEIIYPPTRVEVLKWSTRVKINDLVIYRHCLGKEWVLLHNIATTLDVYDKSYKPIVKGQDLISIGYTQSKELGKMLEQVFEYQIESGIENKFQLLNYIKYV